MSIEERLLHQPAFSQIPDVDTLKRLPEGAVIFTRHGRMLSTFHMSDRSERVWVEGLAFGSDVSVVVDASDLPALLVFNPDWMDA